MAPAPIVLPSPISAISMEPSPIQHRLPTAISACVVPVRFPLYRGGADGRRLVLARATRLRSGAYRRTANYAVAADGDEFSHCRLPSDKVSPKSDSRVDRALPKSQLIVSRPEIVSWQTRSHGQQMRE